MIRMLAIAVAFLLAAAAPAVAGGVGDLDDANGFRDARFGARVETLGGLELLSEHGAHGTQVYLRPSDELRLGDAVLDGVTYGFYQEELYFVAIFTSGRKNARATLAQLQKAYGPGTRVAGDAAEYVWRGKKVTLHFREDPVTAMGMVGLTSLKLDARVKADRSSVPAQVAPGQRGAGRP